MSVCCCRQAAQTSRGSGDEVYQTRRLDVVRIFARHLQALDPATEGCSPWRQTGCRPPGSKARRPQKEGRPMRQISVAVIGTGCAVGSAPFQPYARG